MNTFILCSVCPYLGPEEWPSCMYHLHPFAFGFHLCLELFKDWVAGETSGWALRGLWSVLFHGSDLPGFCNTGTPFTPLVTIPCSCQSQCTSSLLIGSLSSTNVFVNFPFVKLFLVNLLNVQSIFCQVHLCYIEQMSFVFISTKIIQHGCRIIVILMFVLTCLLAARPIYYYLRNSRGRTSERSEIWVLKDLLFGKTASFSPVEKHYNYSAVILY